MSYDGALEIISVVFRILALIFSTTFVIRYSHRNWKSLPEGRHLMGFSIIIVLFMVLSVVNTLTAFHDPSVPGLRPDGDYWGRDELGVILFGATAYYMYKRNKLLPHEHDVAGDNQDDEIGAR